MGYFPFFVELKDKKCLVVGGGNVALRKIEKLLLFGVEITAAAMDFCEGMERLEGVTLVRKPFSPEMIDGMFFVVAASDIHSVNSEISRVCREKNIPVNVVDDPELCTFIFPALITDGSFTAGISTGGSSPAAAVYMKEKLQALVPENFGVILDFMSDLRAEVKAEVRDERARAQCFRTLFEKCLESGGTLKNDHRKKIIAGFVGGGEPEHESRK